MIHCNKTLGIHIKCEKVLRILYLLTPIHLLFFLNSCTSYSTISYQVSTTKDMSMKSDTLETGFTFSFKSDSAQMDKLTEKNLFYLIGSELLKRGGLETTLDKSDYFFTVQFGLDTKQNSGSRTVYVYDYQTKKNIPQQRSYTTTFFSRNVVINLFNANSPDIPIWSANCLSEGQTNDIYFPSQYMVPFAISMMPMRGSWSRSERVIK
jgi:hypothetical protein